MYLYRLELHDACKNAMSDIPVPPPLIPPYSSPETTTATVIENCDDGSPDISLLDLGKYLNRSITRLKPIRQTGPNCGLAALAMVAALTPNACSINDIFKEAASRGFTYNGEMFSALNMKTLAEVILNPWFVVKEFRNGLDFNIAHITEKLYEGALMMVPYDADKNHSPCCVNGHKAHWAVVCGVMEGVDGEVYVAARHGKSRYLAVWSLDSLARSNANLTELDPAKRDDQRAYLLPEGGVREGLANNFILLTRNVHYQM